MTDNQTGKVTPNRRSEARADSSDQWLSKTRARSLSQCATSQCDQAHRDRHCVTSPGGAPRGRDAGPAGPGMPVGPGRSEPRSESDWQGLAHCGADPGPSPSPCDRRWRPRVSDRDQRVRVSACLGDSVSAGPVTRKSDSESESVTL